MTGPDDDWSDLSRTWTDPVADTPEALRADADLIRAVRRRDRLARLNFWGEILSGVVVVAVITAVAMRTDMPWPMSLAAFGFIACGLGLTVWSRRGDPGILTDTPESVLQSAIAQARMGERWAWAGVGTSLAAAAFLAVMSRYDDGPGESRLIAPFAVFLVVCINGYVLHARRCRRRRRAHEAALAALRDALATD